MVPILKTRHDVVEAKASLAKALDAEGDAKGAVAALFGAAATGTADEKHDEAMAAAKAKADEATKQVRVLRAQVTALEEQLNALEQKEALENAESAARVAAGRGRIETHDLREDRPWAKGKAGLGEWAMACLNANSGRGVDPRLFKAAATGMGGEDPSAGAYAVPGEQASEIEDQMFSAGQILSLVDSRDILGDTMTYNILRSQTSRKDGYRGGGVLGYWVDAGEAPTASQIKLARLEMKLRKVGALGYLTDELMQDATALGGELQTALSEELIFQAESKVWEGTGAGTPLGFTKAPCFVAITIEGGQKLTNPILPQNLSKMWARMPPRQKAGAVWCVGSEMMVALDALALPVGTAALEPRFVSYDQTGIMRIKGRPVIEVEYASALGTVADIVLANFKQYRFIKKAGGVQQASSIHVRFAQGETTFRAFYRCDGQPVPRGTVEEYKGTNARTPFVALGTRSA